MWRDIFLKQSAGGARDAAALSEDLTLQRAIRWGEADKLGSCSAATRRIRRSIIEAKQA